MTQVTTSQALQKVGKGTDEKLSLQTATKNLQGQCIINIVRIEHSENSLTMCTSSFSNKTHIE